MQIILKKTSWHTVTVQQLWFAMKRGEHVNTKKTKQCYKMLEIQMTAEGFLSLLKRGNLWVFSSVQFSHSVVSDSLRPHESQHAKPPCPSPTPGVHSDSRPSSQWCHPAISSSVVPFSSCPQSLPASESFPMSPTLRMRWPKDWSFSFRMFLPKNTQGWSPSEWTGWISLQSKGLSRIFSNTRVQKHQYFGAQHLHSPTFTSINDHKKP